MNLKGFKKVHDSGEKAVLKNARGHEIVISKNALTSKHRKDLDGLPLYAYSGNEIVDPYHPENRSEYANIPPEKPLGSKAQDPGEQFADAANWVSDKFPGSDEDARQRSIDKYASQPAPRAQQNIKSNPTQEQPAQEDTQSQGLQEPAPTAQEEVPPREPTEQRPEPAAAPVVQQRQQQQRQSPEQVAAMHTEEANKEADLSWQDRMAGHIRPETPQHSLFQNRSTLGKIGSLFGLLVAGVGSGLTGQPNVVLEMMNKEIERDFLAQQKNQENKQSAWKIYQQDQLNKSLIKNQGVERLGMLKDNQIKDQTLYKNQMLLEATHKTLNDLNMIPNGSPQKAAAMQKFGELQGAVKNEIQQNNARMGQTLVSDPEGSFQRSQEGLRAAGNLGILPGAEGVANAKEERHVPGFGSFTNAVPANVRSELIAKQEYDKAARKYIDFAKEHQGNWKNLNPKQRLEIARRGAVLGAELQGKYRLKTNGGVYKQGEQEYIQKIIPDNAASWEASFNQIPKVEQTIQNNQADTQNLAKGYGGEAPRFYNGKYYMRGKNGESVEVK